MDIAENLKLVQYSIMSRHSLPRRSIVPWRRANDAETRNWRASILPAPRVEATARPMDAAAIPAQAQILPGARPVFSNR